MKQTMLSAVLLLFMLAMLLPVFGSVNNPIGQFHLKANGVQADGSPLPPPPKPVLSAPSFLLADGSPLPPPPKPVLLAPSFLLADGSPLPPPPKPVSMFDEA